MPNFEEIQKARILNSFNIDEGLSELTKAEILDIEKGGKRALIGEKRTFAGREYIKTTDGWKFHGKGTGAKAQSHIAGALEHHVGEKKESEEVGSTQADYGTYLDRSKVTKEDVEKFDNSLSEEDRNLIEVAMKDYRTQGGVFHSPGDILAFKKKTLQKESTSTHKDEDSKESHEKRGFKEESGDEDITSKSEIVTDSSEKQRLRNGIREGEMILQSKRSATGRKMHEDELGAVRRSVENSKKKLGEK